MKVSELCGELLRKAMQLGVGDLEVVVSVDKAGVWKINAIEIDQFEPGDDDVIVINAEEEV